MYVATIFAISVGMGGTFSHIARKVAASCIDRMNCSIHVSIQGKRKMAVRIITGKWK
jgi:hypothetical protein